MAFAIVTILALWGARVNLGAARSPDRSEEACVCGAGRSRLLATKFPEVCHFGSRKIRLLLLLPGQNRSSPYHNVLLRAVAPRSFLGDFPSPLRHRIVALKNHEKNAGSFLEAEFGCVFLIPTSDRARRNETGAFGASPECEKKSSTRFRENATRGGSLPENGSCVWYRIGGYPGGNPERSLVPVV